MKRGDLRKAKRRFARHAETLDLNATTENGKHPSVDGKGEHDRVAGRTALHLACAAGADDVVRWLIRRGADVASVDVHGDTPAHLAAPWAAVRPALLDRLRRAGADVAATNDRGENPQELAARAVERHVANARAAEARRAARREADEREARAAVHVSNAGDEARAWRAKLMDEAAWDDELGGGFADFFASYDEDAEEYKWQEEEDAYERYVREGMAKRTQRRRFGNDFGHPTVPGAAADTVEPETLRHAAAQAQARATRRRDEAAQRTLDEERRKDEAWRARVAAPASAAAEPKITAAEYHSRWGQAAAMADSGDPLSYGDVPWPLSERDERAGGAAAAAALRHVLVPVGGHVSVADTRRALRAEMLRWHPDKFHARLGRCVRVSDRQRVNARVNVVAQLVADLFKRSKEG